VPRLGWFLAWSIPGLLSPLALGLLPIGTIVWAVLSAVVLMGLTARRSAQLGEVLGLPFGFGVWCVLISLRNWNQVSEYTEAGRTVIRRGGGVPPVPFMVVGVVLVVGSLVGSVMWYRWRGPSPSDSPEGGS